MHANGDAYNLPHSTCAWNGGETSFLIAPIITQAVTLQEIEAAPIRKVYVQ